MTSPDTPDVPAFIERAPWSKKIRAYVQCVYCQDRHVHGASDANGTLVLGSRASHCLTGEGGTYHLVEGPPEMTKPVALSTRERQRRLLADDQRRGFSRS